jgi:endogenous inhibitor of DNA gyrase (YacG/DUF329 family)
MAAIKTQRHLKCPVCGTNGMATFRAEADRPLIVTPPEGFVVAQFADFTEIRCQTCDTPVWRD